MLLRLGEHTIDCTDRTAVMGIVNVSVDSPIGDSIVDPDVALERAVALVREGAEMIDVGAHSTRTNARVLSTQEEIDRVCPAIEAIARAGIPVTVDTWRPEVARAAIEAGVHALNDVSGFGDPEMVRLSAEHGVPGIVMHMRGAPQRHREADQSYADIGAEVRAFLVERAQAIEAADAPRPWLDPGFAFGKSAADNVALLEGLPDLVTSGYPVLVSASRKGFLAELLGHGYGQDAPGLLEATVAFNVVAALHGVHVVRVHDVRPVVDALRVVTAVRRQRSGKPPMPTADDAP